MSLPGVRPAEVPFAVEQPAAEVREPNVTRDALVAIMRDVAPPGQESLDAATVGALTTLTDELLNARSDMDADAAEGRTRVRSEYERFLAVRERGLDLPEGRLHEQLAGKTILVTGGTGCIGTALLEELGKYAPARIVSVSRGVTQPKRTVEGVEYRYGVDIREAAAVEQSFDEIKPDIVYHLAAQHDPSLAETEVTRTLETNIFGTRNVIEAARQTELANGQRPQIVAASTGKALRPVTPDIYAASKKGGETLLAMAAQRGDIVCSGVRFTHVVDNSIIHERLQSWIERDEPIRLHGADVGFYLQSALEAAQLLLNSGLEAERGRFTLQAIRNLGAPISLLDLALGAVDAAGKPAAVYFCGFESGYEEFPYPGMYDVHQEPNEDVSALINAWESPLSAPSATCPQVDRFCAPVHPSAGLDARFAALEKACAQGASGDAMRKSLDELAWIALAARLRFTPFRVLKPIEARMRKIPQDRLPEIHRKTNEVLFRVVAADRRWWSSLAVDANES